MIRLAKLSEISEILSMTNACALHMQEKGIFQWNKHYPSKAVFLTDLKRNELYVLLQEDKVIGAIVLTPLIDKEYLPVKWLTENGNNLYVHRLCVHPNYQGKGYAQMMMDFAENHAIAHLYDSVRLDTFSQNRRNQKFYKKRGYERLGNIFFPKQSTHPFHCYELVL